MKVIEVDRIKVCRCGAESRGEAFYQKVEGSEVEFVCSECWWRQSVVPHIIERIMKKYGKDSMQYPTWEQVQSLFIKTLYPDAEIDEEHDEFVLTHGVCEEIARQNIFRREEQAKEIKQLKSENESLKRKVSDLMKKCGKTESLEKQNKELREKLQGKEAAIDFAWKENERIRSRFKRLRFRRAFLWITVAFSVSDYFATRRDPQSFTCRYLDMFPSPDDELKHTLFSGLDVDVALKLRNYIVHESFQAARREFDLALGETSSMGGANASTVDRLILHARELSKKHDILSDLGEKQFAREMSTIFESKQQ